VAERVIKLTTFVLSLWVSAAAAYGQNAPASGGGVAVPQSDRLKINVKFLAGYGVDESQYGLGNESQGRVGYAIVELSGKISDRLSYRLDINPVYELQPLPACGEENFFYPNTPQAFGPAVTCDPDGRVRVDDYKFIALDVMNQQGAIRQAYAGYQSESGFVAGRFGRFILPIGFDWEESGSFTGKDATHIQRINAETNFGFMLTLTKPAFTFNAAGFLGEGNRYHDYNYYYSLDWSLDANSALSGLFSADLRVVPKTDIRVAQKTGVSGSKVEGYPNFYATKHLDWATVASVRHHLLSNVSIFGEYAWYTWGLMRSSAEMIGWSDTDPVTKAGYYIGGDANFPLTARSRIGATVTYEALDRDDALIKDLSLKNLYDVRLGETEHDTIYRVYVDLGRRVRTGMYITQLDNPFPWVSGIWPVSGPNAFTGQRGSNKWGIIARFSLD